MDLKQGGYNPPTSDEVRAILSFLDLTGAKAGALAGCSDRQIRRYTSEGKDKSVMPYAILYTIVHRLYGLALSPENWRVELKGAGVAKPVGSEPG